MHIRRGCASQNDGYLLRPCLLQEAGNIASNPPNVNTNRGLNRAQYWKRYLSQVMYFFVVFGRATQDATAKDSFSKEQLEEPHPEP